jgi:YD repeat-containing protein
MLPCILSRGEFDMLYKPAKLLVFSSIFLFPIGADVGIAQASSTTTYTYDALGRLIAANTSGTVNNGVALTTTYDAADNRTTYVVTGSASKVIVVPINGLTVIPIPDN